MTLLILPCKTRSGHKHKKMKIARGSDDDDDATVIFALSLKQTFAI